MDRYLELSILMAVFGHRNQKRRDNVTPYITHPFTVMESVSNRAKPVAILHDIKEDDERWREILDAVDILTKRKGDDYFEYIERVKKNPLAREVKIADIKHNLSSQPKPEAIEKYKKALEILKTD